MDLRAGIRGMGGLAVEGGGIGLLLTMWVEGEEEKMCNGCWPRAGGSRPASGMLHVVGGYSCGCFIARQPRGQEGSKGLP